MVSARFGKAVPPSRPSRDSRPRKRLAVAVAALTTAAFAAAPALAQSAGCAAVNSGALNYSVSTNGTTTTVTSAPPSAGATYDTTGHVANGNRYLLSNATFAAGEKLQFLLTIDGSTSTTNGEIFGSVRYQSTGENVVFPTQFNRTAGTYTGNALIGGTYNISAYMDYYNGTGVHTASIAVSCITATPSVTSLAPTSGPIAGGTSVVLTGANLSGATAVSFGGTAATTFTVNSSTQITATAPAHSAGAVNVTVTTPGGTSATSAGNQYTYVAAPTVTALAPTAGPTAGGTSVVITGTNLTGATAVTFGGAPATAFTVNGATQITATAPAGSGTVDVRVTTAGGTSATSGADQYTYVAAPTVTAISPTSGPSGGGTSVVITGTNLTSATAVTFGGAAATSYTVNGASQITAVAPAGTGTVDVRVTTAGGTSATSGADQFTYVLAPTVTALSPTAGPTSGGNDVIITGANLNGATAVTFGATPATSFTVDSATQITAMAPAGSVGTVDVTVTTPSGTSATSGADQYTYIAAPTVSAISPSSGPAGGGTTVVIAGTNLTTATAVNFGGVAATSFTVDSATQITATAPAGTGTVDVSVTTLGGTSATSAADQYTYIPAPTVTALSPTSGPTAGGTTVVVTGANLSGATAVMFGGAPATGFTVDSTTQITATAPAGAGTVDVTVATTGGTSATSAADQYTYVAAPTVTGIAPTEGPTAGGTTVVITGTGLTGATAVNFGGAAAAFTVDSATQITATAPAGAGTVDVRVTTAGGTSATSAADQYNYVAAPTVTSVAPTSGPALGGSSVVITGANLSGATAVSFGGAPATGFTVDSATQITATAPAGTGTVDIRVTSAGGTSATSAADQYTYIDAPTVTGIAPASGSTAGGAVVVITGTDLTGATAVTFGGVAATSYTVDGATQITATTPARSAGAVAVKVTTASGSGTLVNGYTYVAPPTLTGFTASAVAYGSTGNSIDAATGASPTGNPTAWEVSNDGVSFGTTAQSANASSVNVSINAGTGAITYAAPTGYRGNDVFYVRASNASGNSNAVLVTVSVSNPTLAIARIGAGTRGTTLSGVQITVSGGAAPYHCGTAVASGALPAGTQLNDDCTISGTPDASGTFNFTVSVTDSSTGTGPFTQASGALNLVIAAPTMSLSPAAGALPGATAGTPYSQSFTASGGTAPYSFVQTGGALPDGLTLSSTGTLSGTPGATGTFNFDVTATDSSSAGSGGPYTATASYSITVAAPAIALAPTTLSDGTVDTPYSANITASGGTAPYNYSQTGTLPPGLTLSAGGVLSGTPTAAGAFNFTVSAQDSTTGGTYSGSQAYTLTIAKGTPTISFGALSDRTLSQSVPALSASSPSPVTIAFSSLTTGVCTVSGTTVTLVATGQCTIAADQASDADWNAAAQVTQSFQVTPDPLTITPGAATGLQVGASYAQANTASGGTTPYVYSLSAGAFVPGTTLDTATGTVSGTPTLAGSFSYIVRVRDNNGAGGQADTPVTTVTIAKGTQTIAFTSTAPAAAAVGGADYSVTASASSGLAVSFTLDPTSTGCALSGGTVSFTGTGTCRINANQAGDANWNAAPQAQQSFSVGAAQAVDVSLSFAPATLDSGAQGTITITFTNSNAQTTPAFSSALHSNNVVFTRLPGLGGSCGIPVGNTSVPTTSQVTFTNITIPAGSCTVTWPYRATEPGTATWTFDGFTPTGYPASSGATSNTATVLPSVTAVSPNSGPVSQVVTITGTGFSTTPGNNTVTFGAAGAGTVTAATSTQLTVTAPATGTGTVAVSVTVNGQTSTNAPDFTFIAAPIAADKPGVAVAYNSAGTAIDLSASISGGPHTSIAIGTAAAHGTTSIAGDVVTYTPAAGYYGADSFTYTATGAGGTSNVATVSITVATPAAPTAADKPGVTTAFNTAVPIDLSASITGVHSSIAIASAPAHGSTSVAGDVITYTPTAGYAGTDSFTYTATGPGGTSAPALVSLAVGQGSQTITFAALPDASLSASPLTLSATADSGLAVTFSSATTTVCTVSGNSLTLLQTGTCTVNADQAGDASYAAAPQVSRSFQVTPANLTITPGAATGLQVGASYAQANTASGGVGPYSYSLSAGAFVPGTTLDTATGTVSGTPTVAGSFSYIVRVTDSQAPAVTVDTPVTTVTIAKGTQTIAFTSTAPAAAAVGGADYSVTASASSGLAVSFALDPTSTGCALSGGTVSFTGTGTCRINANQAGDANWNAAPQVQQSFSVGAAQALGVSLSFAPTPINSGADGILTITFTNNNAQATPAFNSTLHSNSIVFTNLYMIASTCTLWSTVGAFTPSEIDFTDVRIQPGTCTLKVYYRAAAPGTANWTFDGFTPTGYPATSAVTSNTATVLPSVTAVSPNSGPGSQVVTITGKGFSTTPGNNIVNFGAGTGTVTAASATSLTVTAPATGTGTVGVTVTVNGQTSASGPTFTFLAPPVAADKPGVAVPYETATAIDLAGSISGGSHTSVAIGAAPAHGTASIAGDVVTYTPTAGYYGADSFTYTATGPGGTSNVATVSLTVATPAPPVAADKPGVAVVYGSAGTAIDLSASITGVHSAIALATAPTHGTVSIAGDVVTYTPAASYYGADSFTYTATGPGGTSAPATVGITVGNPPAPTVADKPGVAVPYGSAGAAIDLSASITGVHSSIAVATAPAHGTVSIAGDVVTYTPAATYYGADSFTYTATGPGGTSAPATVSLAVATPPAPTVADKPGVAVPYNSAGTAIDLSASITGIHSAIAIGTAPAHGTVSIAGDVVTYTPAADYYGADSFTYTATGPGGTSAPATVSLAVATPAPPVAADRSGIAVAYNSAGTAIDLSASITGVHSAITIGTAPAHGTVSIAGDVVTYTPATGYYGADSFTYTATGPGGTSAAATVSLTVGLPPAPVAGDRNGVTVPYGTATAIDLTASVTGVHSALAIGVAPQHGTTAIAGDVVTYTPAPGYAGPDSFTYTATGPGGTSPAATVTLTVGSPTVAITTDALPNGRKSVAYATTTLVASGGAAPYSFRISQGTLPAGMTLTSGGVLSGTPTEFGNFPVTVEATDSSTGAGPFTATRNYTIMIAAPFPPVAQDGDTTVASSSVTNNQSVDIDLSALVTGEYTDIRIDTSPQHGTATIRDVAGQGGQSAMSVSPQDLSSTGRRFIATYTPNAGYHGQDRFTFVAVGPGGQSAAAAVQITVTGLKPVAPVLTATATAGVPVTVDLTTTAREAPFTGAAIVSVTPSDKATARLIEGGAAQARTYNLEVQTDGHFGGTVVVTYTLTNAFGTSDPATVTLTVNARPDPSADPTVRGLSDAQADAARRFGRVQLDNFQRRNEQLHDGGNASQNSQLRVTLTGGDRMVRQRPGTQLEIPDAMALKMDHAVETWGAERAAGATAFQALDGRSGEASPAAMIGGMRAGMGMDVAPVDGARGAAGRDSGSGERKIGSGAIWSGGALEVGVRDETTRRRKLSLTSAGLSAGLDVKLDDGLILGMGGGYGTEGTDIGEDGRLDARNWVGVVYGSYRPARGAFIDLIAGAGGLDFKTRRLAANNQIANGNRDGTLRFGSVSAGYDGHGELWRISAYGRVDYVNATLGQYSETGAGIYDLRFDKRDIDSLSTVLGARASTGVPISIGLLSPRGRFEWRHEFQGAGAQYLDYADLVGSTYRITGDGWLRDEFSLELGFGLDLAKGWSFGLDVGGRKGQGSSSATVRASVSTQF